MIPKLILVLSAAAVCAAAVGAQVTVEAGAGSVVHDPLAARVSAASASLGASLEGTRGWGYGSLGAPLGGEGPAWAAAGAGAWLARPWRQGEIGLRVEVDAFGYGTQDSVEAGGGVSARLLPGLAWSRGAWRAELGAGAAGLLQAEGDSSLQRLLPEAAGRLAWNGADGVTVAALGRYLRDGTRGFPFAGITAELDRPGGAGWVEAGAWLDGDGPRPRAALGIGGELRLPGRTALAASWRQEPADPLFRSLPRQSWSVAVRRTLGRASAAERARRPAVFSVAGGSVTFRLPRREHPQPPALVSDLTEWRAVPLAAAGDAWTLTLPARPGAHRFHFRTPGGPWLPPGVTRQADGFGGFDAVLVVP